MKCVFMRFMSTLTIRLLYIIGKSECLRYRFLKGNKHFNQIVHNLVFWKRLFYSFQ